MRYTPESCRTADRHPRRQPTRWRAGQPRARLTLILVSALTSIALPAGAQTLYRYTNEKGIVVYSDTPTNTAGQPVDRMTSGGVAIKRPPAPDKNAPSRTETVRAASPEATASSRDAEDRQRRNTALLSTYNSVQEIEASRLHALREPLELLRQAQKRMIAAGRLLNQLQRTAGPAPASGTGSNATPTMAGTTDLAQQLEGARFDLKTQALVTQNKQHEVEVIQARFDDDLKRYIALTNTGGAAAAAPSPPGQAPTPAPMTVTVPVPPGPSGNGSPR